MDDLDPEQPEGALPSRKVGDFELIQELGRGGMGVVYLARQISLGRQVAFKVLPTFAGMDQEAVARFRREAEATARLNHPGIVPVHAVGEVEGLHYFAMEWVQGPNLEDLIHDLRVRRPERLQQSVVVEAGLADDFPGLVHAPGESAAACAYVRSCVGLALDLAEALTEAHENGVVHRDLKPSNVLLHPVGRPVLVDFGLAQDMRADRLTRTGDTVGTPAYMAPEQVMGARDTDGRVDVYGLGALLYELLALRAPFRANSLGELQRAIVEEEPPPLHRINRRVPAVLAAVVHRCMAKDPEERYQAIDAVTHELRAFLQCEPMLTRPLGRFDGLRHGFVRRRRLLRNSAMAGVLIAGTVAGVLAWRESDRQLRGRELLRAAAQAVTSKLDGDRAAAQFATAAELLGEEGLERVAAARRRALREGFEKFYGPSGLEALRTAFQRVAQPEDAGALAQEYARLAGQGQIRFSGGAAAGDQSGGPLPLLEVRSPGTVGDRGLLAGWRPLGDRGSLPMGDYLLRASLPLPDGAGNHHQQPATPLMEGAAPTGARFGASPPIRKARDAADGGSLEGATAQPVSRHPWFRAIGLDRDEQVVVDATLMPAVEPLARQTMDSVTVFNRRKGRSVSVAKHEVTVAAYQRWVAGLRRPLREEMRLGGVSDEKQSSLGPTVAERDGLGQLPVCGLSFAQARAFAAHHDAMLPDTHELWLAATGGLRVPWPWGRGNELDRVAASPDYLDRPMPARGGADGTERGLSITGAWHLLGNVEEAAVAAQGMGSIFAAGGHYQSVPQTLLMRDGRIPARLLGGVHTPQPTMGLRMARTAIANHEWEARRDPRAREQLISSHQQILHYRWDLQTDGSVILEHLRSGTLRGTGFGATEWGIVGEGQVALPLPLDGWVLAPAVDEVAVGSKGSGMSDRDQVPQVLDGHGTPCKTEWLSKGQRPGLAVSPAEGVRAGQRQMFSTRMRLWPADRVTGELAGYSMRLPGGALQANAAVRREIVLPAGAIVDRVTPAEVQRSFDQGRIVLVLDVTASPHTSTTPPIHVHFRVPGMLTGEWPTRREAREAVLSWIDDPDNGPHERAVGFQRDLLDRVLKPGIERAQGDDWLVDVTAVGPIWTCSVDLPLDGQSVHPAAWPLIVRLARPSVSQPLRVLGIAPRPHVDQGVLGAAGLYHHSTIRADVRPPHGSRIEQLSRHALGLQLAIRDPKRPGVYFEVLGHYADSGESDQAVRMRQTGAAAWLAKSQPWVGAEPPFLKRREGLEPYRQELHLFPRSSLHGAQANRAELWSFHRRGMRHVLLKAVATGNTLRSAADRLRQEIAWFQSIAAEVSLP